MTGRLDGKVAVITGGASGIGAAMTALFVAEGARVLVADVLEEPGRALVARHPGAVAFARCDVTVEADLVAALDAAEAAFGPLDVLVNNAGAGGAAKPIEALEAADWDRAFALLLRAPALGIRHAAPRMRARGGGSVVNIASAAGLQAGFAPQAYSVCKAGVIHLTRCAAAELGRSRIRVNALCPGLIATPIFGLTFGLSRPEAEALAPRVEAAAADFQPYPKAGLPGDVARAALFLASDDSVFVTGAHLLVDGGISVGPREGWDPDARAALPEALGLLPPRPGGGGG